MFEFGKNQNALYVHAFVSAYFQKCEICILMKETHGGGCVLSLEMCVNVRQ